MDPVIDYINANPAFGVNIHYATLNEYMTAVRSLNMSWPMYTNDFFPYATDYHDSYWSGYFTSRPSQKRDTRRAQENLHAAKAALAFGTGATPAAPLAQSATVYSGTMLVMSKTSAPLACSSQCQATPGCQIASFHRPSTNCSLFSGRSVTSATVWGAVGGETSLV